MVVVEYDWFFFLLGLLNFELKITNHSNTVGWWEKSWETKISYWDRRYRTHQNQIISKYKSIRLIRNIYIYFWKWLSYWQKPKGTKTSYSNQYWPNQTEATSSKPNRPPLTKLTIHPKHRTRRPDYKAWLYNTEKKYLENKNQNLKRKEK